MAVETVSGDPKNAHLCRLDGAAGNLRLFKADVLDPDALAAAIAGCKGVFHAASPVPPSVKVADPEASTYLTRSVALILYLGCVWFSCGFLKI
jgi:nucleoside-diphosphate-sugar epimerase